MVLNDYPNRGVQILINDHVHFECVNGDIVEGVVVGTYSGGVFGHGVLCVDTGGPMSIQVGVHRIAGLVRITYPNGAIN